MAETMNLPAIILSVIAIGTVVFHAGWSWSTLRWLKENSATKIDIELLRIALKAETAVHLDDVREQARREYAAKEDCDRRHREVDRQLGLHVRQRESD